MNMEDIISDIESTRAHNNKLWMRILRIAMESKPLRASVILGTIRENDLKISTLTGELVSHGRFIDENRRKKNRQK